VDGARYQAVALQPAQRDGEHPAGDSLDVAAQLAEPVAALAQPVDDHDRPLVADPV